MKVWFFLPIDRSMIVLPDCPNGMTMRIEMEKPTRWIGCDMIQSKIDELYEL